MKKALITALIFLFCSLLWADALTDYAKAYEKAYQHSGINETSYNEMMKILTEEQEYPDYYTSQNPDGSCYYYESTPETCLGSHWIDDTVIDWTKKMGMRFIRITLYWSAMADKDGNINKDYRAEWHGTMDRCKKAGIIPVIVVHSQPEGYSFANREECYKAFAEFMAWCVKEYPYCRYWEPWNEMDELFTDVFGARVQKEDGSFYSSIEKGAFYTEMLKLCYPAMKKANPKTIVICGAPINSNEFVEGIYRAGAKDYFDIMNMHTYSTPNKWSFVSKGVQTRAIMNRYGDYRKSLWNTEFGTEGAKYYRTYGIPKEDPLGTFDRFQKEEIASCITINNKIGLYNKAFIYQYVGAAEDAKNEINAAIDFPEGDSIENYSFSILRTDGTPRPSMQWLIDSQVNSKVPSKSEREVNFKSRIMKISIPSDYPVLIK
ncbi:MAG: cellulase family glycosylhydrolase [Armatimonadetes bacterium]|nr:cellulase family glycosylhydrolase [Candidatus Hippobium faecium]